jgi:hypothetical protein
MNLKQTHPNVAETWHPSLNLPLTPEDVTSGSDKKAFWLCDVGHTWEASILNRTKSASGCPVCNNRVIVAGFNDLTTTHPNLGAEWNTGKNGTKRPEQFGAGGSARVWWLCDKGHEWEAKLNSRKNGSGCPYCTGQRVVSGVSDLETLFPEVAKLWHPSKNEGRSPRDIAGKSNKFVWWLCPEGHSTFTKVSNKTSLGRGCGVCANKTLEVGINDLGTTNPLLAAEWDASKNAPKLPTSVMGVMSNASYWWKCAKDGHSWRASIASRQAGAGCPLCANRVVVAGYNDLASTHPALAKEFSISRNAGVSPQQIPAGSPRMYWWICEDGHEWRTSPNIRWRQGTNCPKCSNRRVSETNNLAVMYPYLLSEWDVVKNKSVKTSEVLPLSALKRWWLCKEGHSWKAEPRRRIAGQGCPTCSNRGYSQAEKGYLYLLRKENQQLQQFGISNSLEERLATHKRNGWEILDAVGPADGVWVAETEIALKRYFEHLGLLLPRDFEDKFDGYTESWNASEIEFRSMNSLLEALREWEWQTN